ncbi:hypothetical protein IP98_01880 [Flavobacterium cauense R2A-7]|uniref:Uncharacterized protein n=1 Tax=Flavobacterium cauense R2A-7 TaxID=1341154 RepID=A0A562LVY3_9FLAO|nr:hypothetical protein IP98_01880 [Flavobacterium cauense R2A-7]
MTFGKQLLFGRNKKSLVFYIFAQNQNYELEKIFNKSCIF